MCVSWSGFNKNLNSELCLFGSISKEDGENIWPTDCNTFFPLLADFRNVPKLTSVLLIQKRPLYVLRPCTKKMPQLSIPVLSLLYKEHPMQTEILQDCTLGFFCILHTDETASPYFIIFLVIVIIIFPNTILPMTSIFNVRIEAMKRFAQHSFFPSS